MPLVISKSGAVQYVWSDEVLGEILGHSDFDGEDWTIGDRLIFEDGTESRIKQELGEVFHVWDDPKPADFEEVKRAVRVADAANWEELFAAFDRDTKKDGCFSCTIFFLTVGVVGAVLVF